MDSTFASSKEKYTLCRCYKASVGRISAEGQEEPEEQAALCHRAGEIEIHGDGRPVGTMAGRGDGRGRSGGVWVGGGALNL
jgi:hypothetical protein